MQTQTLNIFGIPAVLYGGKADRAYLFVHGKNGRKEEAGAFADIAAGAGFQVLGIDLPGHGERAADAQKDIVPWEAAPEIAEVLEYMKGRWSGVSLRANSIGAWLSMLAGEGQYEKCLLVSPILDMEKIIINMMLWAGVTMELLERERLIPTPFGETLSWEYLQYAREHRITKWSAPTKILWAGKDELTDRDTVTGFAAQTNCALDIMEEGEHWFHTKEQLEVLSAWERKSL